VPIINGVNKHDGALVWFDKSSLENIFNSDGNKSFSATAFGTDLGVVTSTERLLTSFYLGRSWTGSLEENQDAITDLHTDSIFATPAFEVILSLNHSHLSW